MPIGVPRVPYRMPGDAEAQWVDLYNRMYRERMLFMGQELDDELANQLIGIMVFLSGEDARKPLFMYINSPGGSMYCGLGVYDMLHHMMENTTTLCIGVAASMASLVLTGGTRGQRLALPHAKIMIHQPEGGSRGQASEVIYENAEVDRLREQVIDIYAERTGQSRERIILDLGRDLFMTARQAKVYGLVDGVAASTGFKGGLY